MLSGINSMMWQTQDVLHKKPQLVPFTILAAAGSLIVYRHLSYSRFKMEEDEVHGDVLKQYMALIILQMLPLVVLEMKIMSCSDPVGLFCKFATPVTLTHVFFLGMRLNMTQHDSFSNTYSGLAAAGGMISIIMVYRESWRNIIGCQAVWGLVIFALVASFVTTSLELYMHPDYAFHMILWEPYFRNVFQTTNSYIELVGFVPAVWMVCREDKNSSRVPTEIESTKRTATAFFLFLVGFYVTEDVYNAYMAYELSVLVSLIGLAHLALLMDFACYVLAHIYNPEKLMGDLRKWLPFDVSFDV